MRNMSMKDEYRPPKMRMLSEEQLHNPELQKGSSSFFPTNPVWHKKNNEQITHYTKDCIEKERIRILLVEYKAKDSC